MYLGSLASKVDPLASRANSAISSFGDIASLAKNSFVSLLPGAKAAENGADVASDVAYTEENCAELHAINGIAEPSNPQCTPIMIDDMSTIDDDPIDNIYTVDEELSLDTRNFKDTTDEYAVPEIQEGSNLAKYILLCSEKESPYGYADQNVISYIESVYSTGNNIADSAIGAVPVLGDIIDAASNYEVIDNFGYVTGATCVTNYRDNGVTDEDSGKYYEFGQTATWGENKQYQRFIENDRQAYIEGDIEQSAVDNFLSRHYEEHPLDNSFEGIIARRSGLTKENVIGILNLLEVADFVAEYKPSSLLPTPQNKEPDDRLIDNIPENNLMGNNYLAVVSPSVFFDDRRMRNFA